MAKQALMDKAHEDFEKISLYLQTGESCDLNDEQKRILARWQSAYEILRQFPQKYVAIKKMMLAYNISESQAYVDITNAMKFWNRNYKTSREWLEEFFIDTLIEEIKTNPDKRFRNLETLRRYLENTPAVNIDPLHTEKNHVYINFVINGKNIPIMQTDIQKMSDKHAKALLDSLAHETIEDTSYEDIND